MGIGLGTDFINVPFMYMSGNEIDLSLLFRYANCYPRAIRQSTLRHLMRALTPRYTGLVDAGLINLKPLVTVRPLSLCSSHSLICHSQHRFTLEESIKAFETAADIKSGCTSSLCSTYFEFNLLTSRV